MHEMALAESLVELIEEEARKHAAQRVKTVRLAVGALAAVEPEALAFCFDAAARGAAAEGARLDILYSPGKGWCLDCAEEVPLSERFGACPNCANYHVQMTGGDELRLIELEIA